MKLIYISEKNNEVCSENRFIVHNILPRWIPDLSVKEYDVHNDMDKIKKYSEYDFTLANSTPGYIMLSDAGEELFRVLGVPSVEYFRGIIEKEKNTRYNLVEVIECFCDHLA